MLGHWFDGDGYLVTLSLDGQINEAKAVGKYVGTARFRAQEEQNRNDRRKELFETYAAAIYIHSKFPSGNIKSRSMCHFVPDSGRPP